MDIWRADYPEYVTLIVLGVLIFGVVCCVVGAAVDKQVRRR